MSPAAPLRPQSASSGLFSGHAPAAGSDALSASSSGIKSSGVASPGVALPDEASPGPALRIDSLLLAIGLYLLLVGCVLFVALRATAGHLTYALDDSFIHMAIAKNLAAHGVFGVTSHQFVSASSSILWPFLLALTFKLFGPAVALPLILQLVSGVLLLWLAWTMLRRARVTSNLYAATVLACLVFFLPMVAITFVAMEHLLHALLTLLFATLAVRDLYPADAHAQAPAAGSQAPAAGSNALPQAPATGSQALPQAALSSLLPVLLCAAAVSSARYEGAFMVAAAALLYLLQKRFIAAISIAAAGAAPIVLFGLYSISHGGFFLPNSLTLKRQPLNLDTVFRIGHIALDCPAVFVLVLAALLLLAAASLPARTRALLQLFLATALLHQMLASYGWFYRYEAYLVAFGVVAVAIAISQQASKPSFRQLPHRAWAIVALLVLSAPLVLRGYQSITSTPGAMTDIYRQQFQMAQFFRAYYPAGHVALNDIGTVLFFSDPYCVDLVGLGNTEIARARLLSLSPNAGYVLHDNPAVLQVLEDNKIQIAAVYENWFDIRRHPVPGWILIAEWRVPDSTILGSNAVSFYAVGAENAAQLRSNLHEFQAKLPPEIQARYTAP